MNRLISCFVTVALAAEAASTPLAAQVTLGPEGPVNQERNKKRPSRQEREYRLSVDPARQPEPALKYSLQPGFLQQTPGNGVPYYYRALLMYQQSSAETRDAVEQWLDQPSGDLELGKVKRTLDRLSNVFHSLRTASLREHCDWQWRIGDLERPSEVFSFLLPELGKARSLGRLLALRARVEIAEHRYEDALDTLAIGYKLARDVAEPPTLVNDLVGIAIAEVMTVELIGLIDAPDSPNLYWALAELPRPLIDMRPAMQHEMVLPLRMFPALSDPETAQRTPEEWRDLVIDFFRQIVEIAGSASETGLDGKAPVTEAAALGLVTLGYPRAKRELIEAGYPRDDIEKMSVGQVVAIYQSRTYAHTYHEMFKWMLLPFHEAWQRQQQTQRELRQQGYFGQLGTMREIIPVANLLLPAVGNARRAEVRLSARLDALQAVEALRMYAAEHADRLPSSLSEVTTVPVPVNPVTGKPFPYRLDGATAVLEIPEAPGMRANHTWRIEITVSKP